MSRPLRAPLLLVVGLLLAQAGWLLSVPAFRGIDEFDHVYRAASVARGQWLPSGARAEHGRGELLTVPRDIVADAGPECRARPYTGHDNCAAVGPRAGDDVQVASAAACYEPLYYWVVGTAARPAHGTSAVYVMRLVSMLLCAAFVALAAWTARRWARTGWPVLALVASTTPVLVYSAVVVAPNALEIVAATSLWVALAGLAARGVTPATERTLLLAAVPGAMALATLRSLGVGFLGLTVLVMVWVLGKHRLRELVARHRATLTGCAAAVSAAVLGGVGWALLAAPNRLEEHGDRPGAVVGSLVQLPVWVLQTIGAAPGRTDPAPGVTYLFCGGVLAALSVLALRRCEARVRSAVVAVAVASLVLPLALTLWTYRDVGVVWQGRYGMPFSVGILVLAGLGLDRTTRSPRRGLVFVACVALALGQLVAVLHVLRGQARTSPSAALGLWDVPSPWLVGGLTLLGWLVVTVAAVGQVLDQVQARTDLVEAQADAQLRAVR